MRTTYFTFLRGLVMVGWLATVFAFPHMVDIHVAEQVSRAAAKLASLWGVAMVPLFVLPLFALRTGGKNAVAFGLPYARQPEHEGLIPIVWLGVVVMWGSTLYTTIWVAPTPWHSLLLVLTMVPAVAASIFFLMEWMLTRHNPPQGRHVPGWA